MDTRSNISNFPTKTGRKKLKNVHQIEIIKLSKNKPHGEKEKKGTLFFLIPRLH